MLKMPWRSLLVRCSCVVNDCSEPVTVLPNVENHVSLHIVEVFERAANFQEIVPSNPFDDNRLCSDFVRRIGVLLHGLTVHQFSEQGNLHDDTERGLERFKQRRHSHASIPGIAVDYGWELALRAGGLNSAEHLAR